MGSERGQTKPNQREPTYPVFGLDMRGSRWHDGENSKLKQWLDSAKRFTEAHGDNGVCEIEMCTNDTDDEGGWRWTWAVWNGNMTSDWDTASESGCTDGQIKQYLVPKTQQKSEHLSFLKTVYIPENRKMAESVDLRKHLINNVRKTEINWQ